MIRLLTLLTALLLAAGCSHIPFREPERTPLEASEFDGVVQRFAATAPDSYRALNSVVFDYSWSSFMGLGYLDIDRSKGEFRVVCLNPLGVQLFELSGDRATITAQQVMPEMMRYGDLPTAVGGDIRRIFLNLLPAERARRTGDRYSLTFSQPEGEGTLEYEFAGRGHELTEKRYLEQGDVVWRVSYYEYREQDGRHYPYGIILNNYRHGYQLTIRQKELHF